MVNFTLEEVIKEQRGGI